MKRHHTAAVAAFACTTLVLAGCGQGEATSTSLDACLTDPVGCNAGERVEGGEITWALDGSWGTWNQNTSEGDNAYVSMALVGMWPYTGQFDQRGDFIVNEGLFDSEPELVSEDPVTVEYINGTLDYDEAADRANLAVERVIEDAYSLPLVDTPVMVMVSDRLVNVRDNWASQQRAAYNIAEWGASGE